MKLHACAALPRELAFTKFVDLERRNGAEEAYDELANLNCAVDKSWLCLYGDNNTA